MKIVKNGFQQFTSSTKIKVCVYGKRKGHFALLCCALASKAKFMYSTAAKQTSIAFDVEQFVYRQSVLLVLLLLL